MPGGSSLDKEAAPTVEVSQQVEFAPQADTPKAEVEKAPAPVEEVVAPAEESPAPAEEATAPAEEAIAPAEEAPAPEVTTPTQEPANSADETPALEDVQVAAPQEIPANPDQPVDSVKTDAANADADKADAAKTDIEQLTLTATASDGATITVTGMLPKDTTVTATPVKVDIKDAAVLAAYDITLLDKDKKEIQPEKAVKVSINTPALEKVSNVDIYHVADGAANPEKVTTVVTSGTEAAFSANSFSTYVIVENLNDVVAEVNDGKFTSLQAAFDACANSDTVKLLVDVTESATLPSGKTITLDLGGKTLNGQTTIKGTLSLTKGQKAAEGTITNPTGSAVIVDGGTFTLTDGCKITGCTDSAVVVKAGGTFEMKGGTITSNSASKGGGLYVSDGTVTMTAGTISKNKADRGAGVYAEKGTFDMQGGTIDGNTCDVYSSAGAGVMVDKNATMTMSGDAAVSNNKISSRGDSVRGAGIYVNGGKLAMSGNATISNNYLGSFYYNIYPCGPSESPNGGGVSVYDGGSFIMSENSSVSRNKVSAALNPPGGNYGGQNYWADAYGGGVSVVCSTFKMSGNASITNNTAAGTTYAGGGGISVSNHRFGGGTPCTFTVEGGTISGNQTYEESGYSRGLGGGIYLSDGAPSISNANISNNLANACGGGVYASVKTEIVNCTINSNSAYGWQNGQGGGGICASGLTMDGCTVSDNHLVGSTYGAGGGLLVSGTTNITNSVITGNDSGYTPGGGIFNSGTLTIRGNSIYGNKSGNAGDDLAQSSDAASMLASFNVNGTLYRTNAQGESEEMKIDAWYKDASGNRWNERMGKSDRFEFICVTFPTNPGEYGYYEEHHKGPLYLKAAYIVRDVTYSWTGLPEGVTLYDSNKTPVNVELPSNETVRVGYGFRVPQPDVTEVYTLDESGKIEYKYKLINTWKYQTSVNSWSAVVPIGEWISMQEADVSMSAEWIRGVPHDVTYEWTGLPTDLDLFDETGSKVVPQLPASIENLIEGETYDVDETMPGTVVYAQDSYGNKIASYIFEGWNDPNEGTMGDADVTITGTWRMLELGVDPHTVSYAWSGLPEGEPLFDENGVEVTPALPATITGIVKNQPYSVDTSWPGKIVYTHNAEGAVDGKYGLLAWDDPNNGLMGDSDVVIKGIWLRTPITVPSTEPDPDPTPDPTPEPDPEPTPPPAPGPDPEPDPIPTPNPDPDPIPTPDPDPDPIPTPTPDPEPAPDPTPAPAPAPAPDGTDTATGTPADDAAPAPAADAAPAPVVDELTPLAGPADEAILDDGTPLAAKPWCWVHWYIIIGIIMTFAYGLVAIWRRQRRTSKVDKYDDQVMGDGGDGREPMRRNVPVEA